MPSYTRFFKIYRNLAHRPPREDIIQNFTWGRTGSLRDLTPSEYRELCDKLDQEQKQSDVCNTMRRKIISCFKYCGFVKDDGAADMDAIYAAVIKHGYLKKSLNKYDALELPKLVFQFEQMKIKYMKSLSND